MISPATTTTTPTTPTTTSAAATASAASAGPTQPLDRQAFLKLLVAQISNQDPLQPMQGTEFVTQLSQFAMVEQAMSQSTTLQTLSTQIGGVANNEATSLIGKDVTMRGQTMAYDGSTAPTGSATLGAAATKVSASVLDANGNVVRTIDLGPRAAGPLSVTWDGKDDNGLAVPQGTYTLDVKAFAADGSPVGVTESVTGKVTSISFDQGYPKINLDNGASGAIADLVGVQQ